MESSDPRVSELKPWPLEPCELIGGGSGGGGSPLPTCICCPADAPLDDDAALAADVVEEPRIDCSNCCMIEVLLRLETLKAMSPGTGDAHQGAGVTRALALGALRFERKTFHISAGYSAEMRPSPLRLPLP